VQDAHDHTVRRPCDIPSEAAGGSLIANPPDARLSRTAAGVGVLRQASGQ